jgi:hypothetical protein
MRTILTILILLVATTAQGQYSYHDHHDYDYDRWYDERYGYQQAPVTVYYFEAPSPLEYAQAERIRYDMAVEQYEYRQQRSLAVQAEQQARRDRYRHNYITRRDSGTLYKPTTYTRPVARNNPKGKGWATGWLTSLVSE